MLSPILRIPSGYLDDVDDPVAGGAVASPTGASKFAGQVGMSVELTPSMIRIKNLAVPVAAGTFQYVRLAAGSAVPAVGATVNWDATVARSLYQVTATAGTAAGTVLTANVTPGNYTIIQTAVAVPTGVLAMMGPDGRMGEGEGPPHGGPETKFLERKDEDRKAKENPNPPRTPPRATTAPATARG